MNQILTQDEINALLRGLSDGDVEQEELADEPAGDVRKYDLASQERIIRGRMPTMEIIHDRFARSFRVALAKFLGRACFISVGSIDIIKFGMCMKKLPLPSSLHIFRMPPLSGYALLVVSAPLVFTIIDTLFGGKGRGRVKIEGREYTPIETRLVGKLVMIALDVLRDAWSPVHACEFVYVRSEFNPLAIGIVPPTDVVITVTIEVELEQESSTLTFCMPYSTLEPIRHKLTAGIQTGRLEVDTRVSARMDNNLRAADVTVSAQLARGTVTTRDMLNLEIGDIIPLQTSPTEEAVVMVEGEPKFTASVGTYRGSRALKIIRPLQREGGDNQNN